MRRSCFHLYPSVSICFHDALRLETKLFSNQTQDLANSFWSFATLQAESEEISVKIMVSSWINHDSLVSFRYYSM